MLAFFILGFLFAGVRSQGGVSIGLNSDGTSTYSGRVPLGGPDNNQFSVFGSIDQPSGHVSKGIALDNINGHGLSLSHGTTSFGEQFTGAGRFNLINNGNHKLDANAFITRNIPNKFPGVSNFNTVGGNLDYMFKNRLGASLGVSHTPFHERTDLNAMGKLNIYRSPYSSLDFNAGIQKTITPQFSRTQPFGGVSFTKFFRGK